MGSRREFLSRENPLGTARKTNHYWYRFGTVHRNACFSRARMPPATPRAPESQDTASAPWIASGASPAAGARFARNASGENTLCPNMTLHSAAWGDFFSRWTPNAPITTEDEGAPPNFSLGCALNRDGFVEWNDARRPAFAEASTLGKEQNCLLGRLCCREDVAHQALHV